MNKSAYLMAIIKIQIIEACNLLNLKINNFLTFTRSSVILARVIEVESANFVENVFTGVLI